MSDDNRTWSIADIAATEHWRKMSRPSFILKPRLWFQTGQWHALFGGSESHSGVYGRGRSPEEAYEDFDRAFSEKTRDPSDLPTGGAG